jgi:chromosomal replication initiation ATPase DnaA
MTKQNSRYGSDSKSAKVAIIKRVVAADYGIAPGMLDDITRVQPIAFARQVAMLLCRVLVQEPVAFKPTETAPMSYPSIAAAFSRSDHGTAMHAIKVVEKRMQADKKFDRRAIKLLLRCMDEIRIGK